MKISFITASNSEEVLRSSLLASPDLAGGAEVSVQRGASSAGAAYNRGIADTNGEVMVFVHQDVYLPAGWLGKLEQALRWLDQNDPNWGVIGLFGTERSGVRQGFIYSTGLRQLLGEEFAGGREVETLDEVMLILRRGAGLKFDEHLEGFHLYGSDICLQAAGRGMKNYAIAALCVHNSNGIRMLPWAYWQSYLFMRRKWSRRLPVNTPCMPLTRWGWPAWSYLVRQPLNLALRRTGPGSRVADPKTVWRELSGRTAGAVP
jgi:hypothetical protein